MNVKNLDFANILRAAFICADPKSTKNAVKLSVFFEHLRSACIKPLSKHADEIDPRCQIHQHLTCRTKNAPVKC